jgi:hypothetical protein
LSGLLQIFLIALRRPFQDISNLTVIFLAEEAIGETCTSHGWTVPLISLAGLTTIWVKIAEVMI